MQVLKSLRLANTAFKPTLSRYLHLTSTLNVSKEFEDAKSRLSTLTEDPGSDVKLRIYGLFKQATVGKCNTPKPSMVDFVGRAKWNAWNELQVSQTEAEQMYIDLINELVGKEAPVASATPTTSSGQYKHLLTSIEYSNIYKIVMNRPTKLNAINIDMYNELIRALEEANANPAVQAVCLTGAGEYFCAGNDLTSFSSKEAMANMKQAAVDGGILLEKYVNSFINMDKPLIALVNGPAVGISVTILPMFDLIIASEKASFVAPFTKIAQSPEACSSYTFPRLMGILKANEILLFNRKLSAQEACDRGLVTEVIPEAQFSEKAWQRVETVSKLPKESLRESRRIMRDSDKETLRQINKRECDVLVGRWTSAEFVRVIMEFWGAKQK